VSIAGEYELGRALGAGSTGRVYEAVHRPTGRRVAVKLTGSWVANVPRLRRALLDEATAAARLRHPNVVALLDVGRDSESSPFLVMEYVEGHDLVDWLERWPGWDDVFCALRDVLLALSAAHAAGIVHGDVKPENLLRSNDGIVKLTDFGVARVRDPMRSSGQTGAIAGTPWYMAPEQFAGAGLSAATDLYSFGVVLYELLAGSLPWPETENLVTLRNAKLADLRPLVPRPGLSLPPEMSAFVGRLLAREPRARFRFAAEVLSELEAIAAFVEDRVPEQRDTYLGDLPELDAELAREAAPPRRTPRRTGSLPPEAESNLAGWLARLRSPALFGRDDETDLVAELVRSVVRDRKPRVLFLVGPAGIGKSRIARWGFEEVEARGTMDRAAAGFVPGQDPKRGIRAAIGELIGRPAEVSLAIPSEWQWLADDGGLPFDVEAMDAFVRGEPVQHAQAIELALSAIEAVSWRRPVYLWLDDLGWAEDGSLEVVERIVARSSSPIFVVVTLRTGTADHPRIGARLERLRNGPAATSIEVKPLSFAARKALVQSIVPLAPGVAETLARTAGDTPLVLVQFVLGLLANGYLVSSAEGWRPKEGLDVGWLAIQTAQASVIGARLDRLLAQFGARASDAESLLVRAALLGDGFTVDSLRRTAGDALAPLVDDVLDRALLDGLLRAHDRAYEFEHGLYREGLIERLGSRDDRTAVLREIAAALAHVADHRYSDVTLRIATMLRDAGELRQALRLVRRAVGYSAEMGDLTHSAELVELCQQWLAAAEAPEPAARMWALDARAGHAYFRSDYATARPLYEGVIELAGSPDLAMHAARAHATLGVIAIYTGDAREAERRLELARAVEVAVDDDPRIEFFIYDLAGKLADMRRDRDAALLWRQRYFEIAREHGRRRVINAGLELMSVHVVRGEIDTARSYARMFHEMAEAQRDRNLLVKAVIGETWTDIAAGDLESAHRRIRPVLPLFRDHAWRRTELLLLAAIVHSGETPVRATAATRRFLRAYQRAAHDELIAIWGMEELARRLRARGLLAPAAAVDELVAATPARVTFTDLSAEPARGASGD
jgi:hypothetical protein